jgi:pyruvate kinase
MRRTAELLRRRRTKVVATIGPASMDGPTVEELIRSGVNVFRLNMSHGDHATHEAAYKEVRRAAQALDVPVAVLADLCGPKIRVGRFAGGQVDLADGEVVTVTTRQVEGGPGLLPSQYAQLADDVEPGCRILLADGLLELRVDAVEGTEITCTVVHGGVLKDRKGMNLPDVELSAPCLTAKDREDAIFAAALGVDYFALSFVRRPSDIDELRGLLGDREAKIIAKIEHPAALERIEAIIEHADGIMVARGDLGVELPPEEVPVVQRELVLQARAQHKPVIVATQMLESMIEHPQPTRAEVSDVSTAVFSGADAVMLSAETASGRFPVPAVAMMDRIARRVEANLWSESGFLLPGGEGLQQPGLEEAVGRAVAQLSRDVGVRAIVIFSQTGRTARILSAARPAAPLLAVTSSERTLLQLAVLWGVEPRLVEDTSPTARRPAARRLAVEMGLAERGQRILAVSGFEEEGEELAPQLTVLTV